MTTTGAAGAARCRHDLVRAQCASCRDLVAAKTNTVQLTSPKASSEQVRRLAAAVRAEFRGRAGTKSQRKALRLEVERRAVGLSRADRKLAKELAMAPTQRARAARARRIHEDKLAGIHTSWIMPQNVGRGRRS